jgi:hypothetical protein
MEHLPKRTSLVHETATTLKEWISTGMLSEALPGELQLKGRLGVGRDTLRSRGQIPDRTVQGLHRQNRGRTLG